MQDPGTITRAVNAVAAGDLASEIDPAVRRIYDELRVLGHRKLEDERAVTFQTTDLVHEAFLKLFRPGGGEWQSRAHFFGSAARAMEQLLISAARTRKRRGLTLGFPGDVPDTRVDPVRLSDAISELSRCDHELAELARLRFFAGLSIAQTCEIMGLSERTAKRRWTFARTWLFQHMRRQEGELDA